MIKAAFLFAEETIIHSVPYGKPLPHAGAFLRFLHLHNIPVALIFSGSRHGQLESMPSLPGSAHTRLFQEDICAAGGIAPLILQLARQKGCETGRILIAGSRLSDIMAAISSGAQAAWMDSRSTAAADGSETAFHRVSDLEELQHLIRMRIPMAPGKLPADLLDAYLHEFEFQDPSVLITPGIGEDTAAVDMAGEQVLVLKSDPITFATDAIGQYAVIVNANDIATAGATPRWLLATVLFPVGTIPLQALQVMRELRDVCGKWGITLCGGHTEITDAVSRTVVSGMMAGTVARSKLLDKRNIAEGDRILLTKALAVEGTAILAREFSKTLQDKGISESEILEAKAFLSRISILEEAGIASRFQGVVAMHDVTEGGLATALMEVSAAGKHCLTVDLDRIPVFPLTRRICRELEILPLGLIGSGSLLICCRQEVSGQLIRAIQKAGIDVTCIGSVGEPGKGIQAFDKGRETVWPEFEVDEIARLFST